MPWVKFPNYINRLLKLRAALQVAHGLEPIELADDATFGYALLEAGVITSRSSVEELKARPRANQGPITYGRGLPEMFRLLGLMVREGDRLLLTDSGRRIAAVEGEAVTDDEVDLWRASLLGLRFPHEAFPEKTGDASFRPAHVMLSMLEQGPVPGQGLAFAFAAGSELPNEIQRLRNLAARWSDQNSQALAAEASTTVSELRNNAKVFPGLLEQAGLIRRSDGWAYATTDGLDALGVGRGAPPAVQTSSVTGRRRRSRPIGEEGPTSWVPDPIDPEDAAERAFLGILRRERANSAHEAALRQLNDWLLERGFRTAQAEYDILATRGDVQVLVEVKSLSAKNRRTQTVRAIGQLAYYHHSLTMDAHEHQPIVRMTFFDREPGDPTILSVLEQENIQMAWVDDDQQILFADPGFHQLLDTTE